MTTIDQGGALRTRMQLEGPDRGGWHQNWVALTRSIDVAPGAMLGMELYGERVLVTRQVDGTARVLSGNCRHLGADLSVGGKVAHDCIVCPFHHWTYTVADGRGTVNGFGQPLPAEAELFAFPTRERWGLIWAFNGPEPLYDVPGFEGYEDDDALAYDSVQYSGPSTQETWVAFSNSHDFNHLQFLHEATKVVGPDNFFLGEFGGGHDITFEMPSGRTYRHKVRVHGTNLISLVILTEDDELILNLFTSVATAEGMRVGSTVTATLKDQDPAVIARLHKESWEYGSSLAEQDLPVLNAARFQPDILQPIDRELGLYFDYVKAFPRHDPYARYRRS